MERALRRTTDEYDSCAGNWIVDMPAGFDRLKWLEQEVILPCICKKSCLYQP